MGGRETCPLWFFASFLSLHGKTILCPKSLNYIIYMALVISQLTMLNFEKVIFGKSTISLMINFYKIELDVCMS